MFKFSPLAGPHYDTGLQKNPMAPPSITHTFIGHSINICIKKNLFIKCVHFTYLLPISYIHIHLSSCHLGLVEILEFYATFKLMGCGLTLGAFGFLLLDVPLGVDLRAPPPNPIPRHREVLAVYSLH